MNQAGKKDTKKKIKRPSKQIKRKQKQNHKKQNQQKRHKTTIATKRKNQQNPNKKTAIKVFLNHFLPHALPTKKIQLESKSFSSRSLSWTDLLESCKSSRSVQRWIKEDEAETIAAQSKPGWSSHGTVGLENTAGCLLIFSTCWWIYFNSSQENSESQRALVESSTKSLPSHIYYYNASKWILDVFRWKKAWCPRLLLEPFLIKERVLIANSLLFSPFFPPSSRK